MAPDYSPDLRPRDALFTLIHARCELASRSPTNLISRHLVYRLHFTYKRGPVTRCRPCVYSCNASLLHKTAPYMYPPPKLAHFFLPEIANEKAVVPASQCAPSWRQPGAPAQLHLASAAAIVIGQQVPNAASAIARSSRAASR